MTRSVETAAAGGTVRGPIKGMTPISTATRARTSTRRQAGDETTSNDRIDAPSSDHRAATKKYRPSPPTGHWGRRLGRDPPPDRISRRNATQRGGRERASERSKGAKTS